MSTRYRVVFRQRADEQGSEVEHPAVALSGELSEGVVLDASIVEREQPPALHNNDVMDEDDDFMSLEAEVWEYDVADGRDVEFVDGLKSSRAVVEYQQLGDGDSASFSA